MLNSPLHTSSQLSGRSMTTLTDLLRYRAQQHPDKMAYTFLRDGEIEECSYSFAELEQQARIIAGRLQATLAPGARILLLYPNGIEYVAAFFGCLFAGMVAVPAYPPRRNRSDQRLSIIAGNAGATTILTTSEVLERVEKKQLLKFSTELKPLDWIASDDLSAELAEQWQAPAISGEDLAFLQYTSGSTGNPKGVMVSHANLLCNLNELERTFGYDENSVMVTWLPIFHDMGLIYGILGSFYSGFSCYLMMPGAFQQKPLRWLQAISRFGGTHTAAPNFAFDLCVERATPDQLETLDLSSLRAVLNGAEPVRKATLEQFSALFQACGFKPAAFCPGYGLAEGTLVLAAVNQADHFHAMDIDAAQLSQNKVIEVDTEQQSADKRYLTLVGCGGSEIDTQIVIVDPQTLAVCQDGYVGEIWAAGHTIPQGYWQNFQATNETFKALTRRGDGPFLRTGDMGFVQDNNLYITGRLKDVIVIRGANYYPNDIELTVEQCHPALNPGGSAAFSVDVAGQERLVVLQEVRRTELKRLDVEEVMNAIRGVVAEQHELQVYSIVLINPATLPKTSSGKVQRSLCRQSFLADEIYREVARWQQQIKTDTTSVKSVARTFSMNDVLLRLPEAERAACLLAHVQDELLEVMGISPPVTIDLRTPLFAFGVDSLQSVMLVDRLETTLGVRLPETLLFDYPTLEALIPHLLHDKLKLSTLPEPATKAVVQQEQVESSNDDDLLSLIDDELKDIL